MRNPSAFVPNILNAQICCILCALLVLGLGFAHAMLIFVNFFKLPKFTFSNFHTGVRARGVAAWQILPARRRPAAASCGGVHPCTKQGRVL